MGIGYPTLLFQQILQMAERVLKHSVLIEFGSTSCSGIIVSAKHGHILTHSSLLLGYLLEEENVSKELLKMGQLSYSACRKMGPVKVICEQLMNNVVYNKTSLPSVSCDRGDAVLEESNQIHVSGHVSLVWFANTFKRTVSSMFSASDKWTFIEETKSSDGKSDEKSKKSEAQIANYSVMFLPCFVLISVGNALRQYGMPTESTDAHCGRNSLSIGQTIFVVATPFGNLSPSVFLNSVSKGIVSNLVGAESELILTDARCIPGTEGGALYTDLSCSNFPVGMVVAPLCWKAGEWIGMSLACRMQYVLKSLGQVLSTASRSFEIPMLSSNVRDKSRRMFENVGVVLVSTPNGSWGSGIIIDWSEGLILTCSHVVKTDREVSVHTTAPSVRKFVADVVMATEGDQVYDLALLRLRKFNLNGENISIDLQPKEGDPVYILGHAAWGINHRLNASLTSGVISKIVFHGSQPVLIQTSCCVNAGASGGPLLSQSGRLLGIAVCNARDMLNEAWYPHVNMCVPVAAMWPAISTFLRTGDVPALRAHLTTNNRTIQKLWSLQLENSQCSSNLWSKL